jgi:hypothetical protein
VAADPRPGPRPPPRLLSAYGNYGAALAGGIVERVSGLSFDEYVEKNILSPLGMSRTTSRQPLPAALLGGLSQCYRFKAGAFEPSSTIDIAVHAAPAGSFRSTATDVARLMIAHLEGGGGILSPDTARLMQTRSFSHDPRIGGMAHGFWELDAGGERIIGHAGSHIIFGSSLLLFPERHFGVFVAANSEGGNLFLGQNFAAFNQDLIRHFFPARRPAADTATRPAFDASRYVGSYHLTLGRSESTPERLMGLVMAVDVSADADGLVVLLPEGRKRFVEQEPSVFRQTDGDAVVVFHEDGRGRMAEAFYSPIPLTALVRNRWYETPAFNFGVLLLCLLAFSSFVIAGPILLLRGRGTSEGGRMATAVGLLASVSGLLAVFCAATSIFDIVSLYTGHLPLWSVVIASSVTIALCTPAMVVQCLLAWRRGAWGVVRRVHFTFVTVAAVSCVWFLATWNLLARGF